MKKSELKNIIKECVREVIFEEGALSGIVKEVVQGLDAAPLLGESRRHSAQPPTPSHQNPARKKVMDEIASSSYEDLKKSFPNPELFEGTRPIQENKGGNSLQGIPAGESGVDISNIPGFGNWSTVATPARK